VEYFVSNESMFPGRMEASPGGSTTPSRLASAWYKAPPVPVLRLVTTPGSGQITATNGPVTSWMLVQSVVSSLCQARASAVRARITSIPA
jgi:hypothetical protein